MTVWDQIVDAVPMFDTRVLMLDVSGNLFLADMAGKLPTKLFTTSAQAESWDNKQVAWQSVWNGSPVYVAPTQ